MNCEDDCILCNSLLNLMVLPNLSDYADIGSPLHPFELPCIDVDAYIRVCRLFTQIVRGEPSGLELSGPIVAAGDLHGHIFDLFRVLEFHGLPSRARYIFLGDLVDRGEFSTETLLIVFLLKVLFPRDVFVIRGNHEFKSLCTDCGFTGEIAQIFPVVSPMEAILEAFTYIPLAAIINKTVLCVHGGIGPPLISWKQLCEIQRPVATFNDPLIASLVWSDPSKTVLEYQDSPRGSGYLFGELPLRELVNFWRLDLVSILLFISHKINLTFSFS
jgi:protein phosphatase